jgi:signal transduction histidine kinase
MRAVAWALAGGGSPLLAAGLIPLRSELGLAGYLFLTLLLVVAAAVTGGMWPALVAVAVGFFAGDLYFAPPYGSLTVDFRLHNVPLFAYLIVGIVIAALVRQLSAYAVATARSRDELAASRTRIVTAADEARRQLERDLHDGAQQRLVSLALRLRVAQRAVPEEALELDAALAGAADELTGVIDELRTMARGIHPAILAQGGLAPALRTLSRRSEVPVELSVDVQGRLPDRVEVAAYYVVSEMLTNVAKHAQAALVTVDAAVSDGLLRLVVSDDGTGGADPTAGSGLTGLSDRVQALGGSFSLVSPSGDGTRAEAVLPLDAG